MTDHEDLSRSFGAAAGAYEAGRPDYPLEVVRWLLEPARLADRRIRVVDAGAGTGKLTRVIVEAEAEVVAVDPDPDMLAVLRSRVIGVPAFTGTAEHLPLPDASVDAVLLGQAWHWVAPDAGAREAARVLGPGGLLGLVWNIRDDDVHWVAELTEAMRGSHAERMLAEDGVRIGLPFPTPERKTWRWVRTMDRTALLDMVASRSYVITADPTHRAEILASVEAIFDRERRDEDGTDVVDLPYRTEAFRSILP
ncbi:class I SAM-dependent methyltransferase [Microbacterium sp. SLBN-146]|uniref:class I SAM-dependent methyltransferase n=1 Tax=Microbacterium sp. SLBN-146 TaxID=2768457 RepID=UPI00114E04F9|nr:class I SAM-dependent methyltransferase [Microbacterium sp. SLBN-146]TQJ31704.1 methyltransferase family protein [Microbacterium sp. SLBN-146]